jgi:Putative adhesin
MNVRFRHATLASLLLVISSAGTRVVHAQGWSADGFFQRTLNVSSTVDLDVSTGSGRIEVRAGSSDRVELRGTIRVGRHYRGRRDAEEIVRQLEANPPIQQIGNVIRIGRIDDPNYRKDVSISYEITAPVGTKLRSRTGSGNQTVVGLDGPVDVGTGSGTVAISDINGEVRAETGSGSIRMNNVKGGASANTGSGGITAEAIGGEFRGTTGSGSVRLTQTAAGNVAVSTGSGTVDLSGIKGALRVRTGSGRVTVDGDPLGGWDLQANSGGVIVRLPRQAAFNLDARSGSGGVTVDHPLTIQGPVRHNEITGAVRGGGFALIVRTGSGGIRIE